MHILFEAESISQK